MRWSAIIRFAGIGLAVAAVAGCSREVHPGPGPLAPPESAGRIGVNRYQTPTGQLLTPAGLQVELPGMRPMALALSPDGTILATAGKNQRLVLIDPANGRVLQTLKLSAPKPGGNGTITAQLSFNGLVFSPDSRRLYFSDTGGNVWVFPIDASRQAGGPEVLHVPEANVPQQKAEIPTGLAVSEDGTRLYVAGNLGNRLHELEASSGKVLRSWKTGVAPHSVVLAAGKAYVSNRGGRQPDEGALTAPAGKGTRVRVDRDRYIASEGSVTVIDLAAGHVATEIQTGPHASGLAVSPDGQYVVVANTGDDTLQVIQTRTDRVVEKIWARQTPAEPFGAQPNALAFEPSGRRLYVCNGTQNAVAVVSFRPGENASRVEGLIPVGWFPGAIEYDARRRGLCVANMKGVGATREFKDEDAVQLNTKDFFGTISLVAAPSTRRLAAQTRMALHNMRQPRLEAALLRPRPDQTPRPVPERSGEPSVFKHVVYIIKENRTYDQVLGDMPEGNGALDLCIFGGSFTPNQHKIAREFVLLDNTYCAGVQSADGHQWIGSAIANDYLERQISANTPRSYPGGKSEDGADALAWASSGFIWDNARAHGKTIRNFGEWAQSEAGWADRSRKTSVTWRDFWTDYQTGDRRTRLACRASIESLRPFTSTNTVGWDPKVPDVMRAAEFIRELRQCETSGEFPNLVILFLPNDHSAGTAANYPTPGAQVADNDLALGQIVEAISKSRFWPETCLIAIEDDPQFGWDHVSAYRTTCYVVSPYTKRGVTISTHYTQPGVLRTIELILGLPPMNYLDATATPMTECFTNRPDFTPFASVPNQVPLDQMNPEPKKVSHPILRRDAVASGRLPLDEVDRCPEDALNQILWRAMKGPETPFPEWAVKRIEDED